MEIIQFKKNHPDLAEHGSLNGDPAGVEVVLSQEEYEFLKFAARAHYERIRTNMIAGACPDEFENQARKTFMRIDGTMRQIANYDWPRPVR